MIPARFGHLTSAPCPGWLRAALAEIAAGVREVSGGGSNPRILQYRATAHTPIGGDDSAVPWCAIAVNAMLESSGIDGSRSAMARSFLRHPAFESLDRPALGCIAVKSSNRGPSSGHVGFYVGEDGLFVYLAGGNQNDSWSIAAFRKREFIGWRWPKGEPRPPAPWDGPYRLTRPALPHERARTSARDA